MPETITHKDLEAIQQSIKNLERKVDRALSYLYDDDETSTPGLVQQVRQNTRDISEIKEEKRVDKKVSVGLGIGGGSAVMIIYEAIKWVVLHLSKS